MTEYLHFDQKTITDFSEDNLSSLYSHGYVFTRLGKGVMDQTRSVRINLKKFALTSENRRILKKVPDLELKSILLPISDYDWSLGKLAKDFYETKFGPKIMSAQKMKVMMTSADKSNFNVLLNFTNAVIGYAICYANRDIIHYSYPFYDLKGTPIDMGLAMMITAIQHAKDTHRKYIYLGSLQRPGDTYKLQFDGLEWFDGEKWQSDVEEVKKLLKP